MGVRIMVGDCRKVLRTLPDDSVHCIVTSPPYWGLRDYGVAGQLGMERTLGEFIDVMVDVFAEVRRVLRPDGTLWLNLGDSYATSPNGRSAATVKELGNDDRSANKGNTACDGVRRNYAGEGYLKPKDLCGIPWRVAFALQSDGWWLRQDIIWSKPNPMPESVTDRCTKAHEYLFLLSKAERYFYDAEAIAERATSGREDMATNGLRTGTAYLNGNTDNSYKPGRASGNRSHKAVTEYEQSDSEEHRTKAGLLKVSEIAYLTRNKRSVWEIATSPFPGAHFATFPPALIEPCVLAGCPNGGTVLDPFGGAGTTGLVADRLGRNAILIELNQAYAEMAERRIRGDAGMFAEVTA
jgi:DNA modification methylase